MKTEEEVAISDIFKLTVADHFKKTPIRTEHTGRYWAYYAKRDVDKLLEDYESGHLRVIARDFVSSLNRVKDRIFEAERARARSGGDNANRHI
jgi:hypothetical protein